MQVSARRKVAIAACLLASACGGSDEGAAGPGPSIDGGFAGGGAPGAGGTAGAAGAATGGATQASGGAGPASGGAAPASGGATQAGGTSGTGGVVPDGGGAKGSFDIAIDYRFDTLGTFTPERRAALEAAAKIWEGLLTDEFENVPAGTALRCRDPKQPFQAGVVFTVDYEIDDLEIFPAFAAVDGVGTHLAESSNSFTNQVTDAALLARLNARYNENPFQPWMGTTSYDETEPWFFDATPDTDDDIPATSNDFIDTALHEIGHLLGVGNAAAWDALVQNGYFTGAHAAAVNGGPVLLSPDGAHIDKSVLTNGVRNLMDPSSPEGGRKRPTALDLAILQDLGYHLAP